jgi:hypothetical protein
MKLHDRTFDPLDFATICKRQKTTGHTFTSPLYKLPVNPWSILGLEATGDQVWIKINDALCTIQVYGVDDIEFRVCSTRKLGLQVLAAIMDRCSGVDGVSMNSKWIIDQDVVSDGRPMLFRETERKELDNWANKVLGL